MPANSRKSAEVSVRRMQHAAIFDRERGQMRVSDQWSSRLTAQDHLLEKLPMVVSRAKQPNIGLLNPLLHYLNGFSR